MSLFSELEKGIERSFRRWTERVFGPAESNELLLVHHAILEEIETRVQTVARGERVFPFSRLVVTLASPEEARRALYQAAFAEGNRLESDIREALEGAGCQLPRGFTVEVRTAETAERPFRIEYQVEAPRADREMAAVPASLVVVKGKAAQDRYELTEARTNIGRLAELTDHEHRVIRRNDVVFEEGADDANATVSRRHAHIRMEDGGYRLCDDESEFGTRVFRDGRAIDVPSGNRRGERLRSGDEIYLGRACLRFEQSGKP
ncbi:MAG TPA: FHA domain-containing protein [Bryobacteraceae bacterium]|nr:FHA domain-containing protein [Bryobacteraceae bacterium]